MLFSSLLSLLRRNNSNNTATSYVDPSDGICNNQRLETLRCLSHLSKTLIRKIHQDTYLKQVLNIRTDAIEPLIGGMEKKIDEVETTNKIIVAHLESWIEYQVSLYKKDKNSY